MATSCIRFSWITAHYDGAEHAVTDEAEIAGREAGKGFYEAMCGVRFLEAMAGVPAGRCSACRAVLAARRSLRDFDERMNRLGWLSRLFCHRRQPADVGSDTTTSPDAPTSAGTHEPSAGAGFAPEDLTTTSEPAPAGARHRRGRHTA